MKGLFNLEIYHFGKNYWRTFGPFETRELAEYVGKRVEKCYPMVSCSISGMDLITTYSDLKDLEVIHKLII